jgi:lipopolysaccharide transport system permease protein
MTDLRVALPDVAPVSPPPTTRQRVRIDSRRRWLPDLRATAAAWPLLLTMSRRNITVQYRQTMLGVVWAFASPLVSALLFTFVFGTVANLSTGGTPYFAFAYSGLLGWGLFSDTLGSSAKSFQVNSNLVTKIYFPRLILPLATVASGLINLAVTFSIMVVLLLAYGIGFSVNLLLLPAWLLLILFLASGVGLVVASLGVKIRDMNYVTPFFVSMLLYLTPVAYPADKVPHSVRTLYLLNPMAPLVEACRWSLLGRGTLDLWPTLYAVGFVIVALLGSLVVFARLEWSFADVI